MPVVRIENRIAEVIEGTLNTLAATTDDVQFSVWMDDYIDACPEDYEGECPGHESHEMINVVISLAIDCGNSCGVTVPHRSKTSWAMSNSLCYSNEFVASQVIEAWEQMSFQRQTHSMGDLDQQMDALVEDHEQ